MLLCVFHCTLALPLYMIPGGRDNNTGVTKDQVDDRDIHEVSHILLPVSTFWSYQSEKYGNSSTAFSNLFMSILFYPWERSNENLMIFLFHIQFCKSSSLFRKYCPAFLLLNSYGDTLLGKFWTNSEFQLLTYVAICLMHLVPTCVLKSNCIC